MSERSWNRPIFYTRTQNREIFTMALLFLFKKKSFVVVTKTYIIVK